MNLYLRYALTLVILIGGIVFAFHRKESRQAFEFYNYWIIAKSAKQNPPVKLYDEQDEFRLKDYWAAEFAKQPNPKFRESANIRKEIGLHHNGTPFFYAMSSVFGLFDFEWGFFFFNLIQVLLVLVSTSIFLREMNFAWFDILVLNSILMFINTPLHWDLSVANGSPFQLFFAALLVWLLNRNRLLTAGIVAGLAIALKPNFLWVPSAVIVCWTLARKWEDIQRVCVGAGAGGFIAFYLTNIFWQKKDYWSIWYNETFLYLIRREDYSTLYANLALVQILSEVTPIGQIILGIATSLAWMICLFLFLPHNRTTPKNYSYLIALGCLGLILVPKIAWFNYILLVIPALLYFVKNYVRFSKKTGALIALATCAVLFDPDWLKGYEFHHAVLNVSGVLVIFAVLLSHSFSYDREARPQ